MNSDNTILVIDDEIQIRRLLEITLESNGYDIIEAGSGREGINLAASHKPVLVILDLGLPDGSGHSVLKQLREWYTSPIIILSVQSNEEDIVAALDNGANDYLIKPFRTGELLARIRSTLRSANAELNNSVFEFGDLYANLAVRIIKKKNVILKLTATEYKLMSVFMQQAGKVLTHQYLLREIWGPGYINQSQYLRVFVAQLRKKIEDDPNRPVHIITEPGVGYRFTTEN